MKIFSSVGFGRYNLFLAINLVCASFTFGQSQYVLNGSAFSTSCACYTVTNAIPNQVGSVWNANLIDLNMSFDMTFDIFLGCNDGGADGMVFALQPLGTNIGTTGGGMGMSGVMPAVGVYIDTYMNNVDFDPVADHLSIQANGDKVHDNSPDDLTSAIPLPNMEDCNFHTLQVIWDAAATQLTVLIDGTMYASITTDLVTNIFSGNPNVFWGFTAATGGLSNLQRFCTQADLLIDLSNDTACVNQSVNMNDSSVISGNIVSWEWDFGDNTPPAFTQNTNHTYASPGVYTISLDLTDISGCVYNTTTNIEILEPVINQMVTNSACNACDGEIEIQASASVGSYQFSIDGGNSFQSDSIFTGVCGSQIGQIYNLVVEDQFGCQNSTVDTVFDDKPQIDSVVTMDSDCLTNNGSVIEVNTIGGSAPYTYSIDGVSGFQFLPITNLAPNLPATYNLIVQDNFVCGDTVPISIAILNEPSLDSIQVTNESCFGVCDGGVLLSGTNLVNYSIDNGMTYSTSGMFNNLCEGTYDVLVDNGSDCELIDQFTITKPASATPLISANTTSGCVPLSVDLANLSTGQITKTTWSFSDGTHTTVIGAGNHTHNFNNAGLYDVGLTVTTADGCVFKEQWPSYIEVLNAPEANYTYLPKPATIFDTKVNFTNTSTTDAVSWSWDFGKEANPGTSSEENPVVIYPLGIEAAYPVILSVANQAGCLDSIKGYIHIESGLTIYAPNVFTPGGLSNSGWRVYGLGVDQYEFHLTVFSRWGNKVWESYNPDVNWDGTYGSGTLVPDDTYVWLLKVRDSITATGHEFKGTVTILK